MKSRVMICYLVSGFIVAAASVGNSQPIIPGMRETLDVNQLRAVSALEEGFRTAPFESFTTIREVTRLPEHASPVDVRARRMAEWGDEFAATDRLTDPTIRHVISWVSPEYSAVVYEIGGAATRVEILITDRVTHGCVYMLGPTVPYRLSLLTIQGAFNPQLREDPDSLLKSSCLYREIKR